MEHFVNTAVSATRHGIEDEKVEALYTYQTSPLFDERAPRSSLNGVNGCALSVS